MPVPVWLMFVAGTLIIVVCLWILWELGKL
jgi:hypothetical protein